MSQNNNKEIRGGGSKNEKSFLGSKNEKIFPKKSLRNRL